jgi:hypothetical protein
LAEREESFCSTSESSSSEEEDELDSELSCNISTSEPSSEQISFSHSSPPDKDSVYFINAKSSPAVKTVSWELT